MGPSLLYIVDLESDIWGHPAGLDRREVDANDFGIGIYTVELLVTGAWAEMGEEGIEYLLSTVNGPDTISGAEVEYFLRVLKMGRCVKAAFQC